MNAQESPGADSQTAQPQAVSVGLAIALLVAPRVQPLLFEQAAIDAATSAAPA